MLLEPHILLTIIVKLSKKLKILVNKITGAKGSENFCSNGAGLLSALQIFKKYYGREEILIQNNTNYIQFDQIVLEIGIAN